MALTFVLFRSNDLPKIFPAICAVFIHESGHILMALALKLPIKRITMDIFGAYIETAPLMCSYKKEAFLSLAGPIANIISTGYALLFPISQIGEYFVVSSLVFAAVNLLPAKDFDGGRILFCILISFCSLRVTNTIMIISSFVCIFLLWYISVYFLMRTGAYLSLFIFSTALFAKLFIFEESSQTNFKE
jgi:Zn-dependent protease